MINLLDMLNVSKTVYYVILNAEDNTVEQVSDTLMEMFGVNNCKDMMLKELMGCASGSGCANSAVNIDMSGRDKVIHMVNCSNMQKNFLVIKFKVSLDGAEKHAMIFTEADSYSPNTTLMENLDSVITHEVNNSLTHMSLINQNLAEDITHGTTEDAVEMLNTSNSNIQVISRIMTTYKELKKNIMQDSYLSSDSYSLPSVIQSCVDNYYAFQKNKHLKVSISTNGSGTELCNIHYNKRLMYLLFTNLINNSMKYAPDETEVKVHISKEQSCLSIEIANEGVLDDKIAENFFSKNTKGSSSNGSGMGTYCSKLITDMFNGSISMTHSDGLVRVFVSIPA